MPALAGSGRAGARGLRLSRRLCGDRPLPRTPARRRLRSRKQDRPGRLPRAIALPAALLRCRARDAPCLVSRLRCRRAAGVRHAFAFAGRASTGTAAHRLPFRRPQEPRDGQDDVGGGAPSRPRPIRDQLLFDSGGQRRVDRALPRAWRPLSDARRLVRPPGRTADGRRRSRCSGRPVDAHQGRAARHSRIETGAGADHAHRQRRRRRPVGDRLQAHRRLCRSSEQPGFLSGDAVAHGGLRLSVSTRRARCPASVSPRTVGHPSRRRRARRVRQPAKAVAAMPGTLARGPRAHTTRHARDLAAIARSASCVCAVVAPGRHSARAGDRPAAGAR